MSSLLPPRWAEGILRSLLAPKDRETFSGDLLEAYRDSVVPSRGALRADLWYVGQVANFVWRQQLAWAFVISTLFVARTALDWLVPAADFAARAATSTYLTASMFLLAGAVASWRSRTIAGGIVASAAAASLAAAFSVVGVVALLVVIQGDDTMVAIARSGGLAEVFVLPLILILPGSLIGTAGAVAVGLACRGRMSHGEDTHPRLRTH
jgi:hypothetical protein